MTAVDLGTFTSKCDCRCLAAQPVQLSDGRMGLVEKVTLDKTGAPTLQVGSNTYKLNQVVAYDQPQDPFAKLSPSPVGP